MAACVAVTAISFFAARALTHHRSSRPSVTPADSGLTYQVVPLKAKDGTALEGWWIIPKDGVRRRDLATVVLAHAADGEKPELLTGKAGMLRHAVWLSRAGFIVLAFDFRSYGGSEGQETTGGVKEQQDLEAALRLVRERAIGAPVALLGEGMGANVGLRAQAQEPGIRALIADSPAPNRMAALRAAAKAWTKLGLFSEQLMAQIPDSVALGSLLRMAGAQPLMLILGTRDRSWTLRDRQNAMTQIGAANATWAWQPASGRLSASLFEPGEYEQRVLEFLGMAFDSTAQRAKA